MIVFFPQWLNLQEAQQLIDVTSELAWFQSEKETMATAAPSINQIGTPLIHCTLDHESLL